MQPRFPPMEHGCSPRPTDNTARLWDAASGQELQVLRGHEDTVRSAVFSPDGARVLTASEDQHRPALGRRLRPGAARSCDGHEGRVTSAVFSPDGARVLTASDGQHRPAVGRRHRPGARTSCAATRVRSTRPCSRPTGRACSPRPRTTPPGSGTPPPARSCAVLRGHADCGTHRRCSRPDGARVLTASDDRTARLWDAASGAGAAASCAAARVWVRIGGVLARRWRASLTASW